MFMFVTGSFYLPPFSNAAVLKHSLGLVLFLGPGGVSKYIYDLFHILCNGHCSAGFWLKSGILWEEMIWGEAPTSFQGALLALCPIMCSAFCVHCLLHMDFEVLLFSLSPCRFICLSLSLFSPLWVAFDAFAFYEWFSLTPASPCLSFLSIKQWVFFLSNNVDKLQLVKCHFPCLLPFWASFPSCSSQRFTFNCTSNTHGVHQCGTFGAWLLWRGDGNY